MREVGGLLEAKAIHPGRSARAHLLTLARSNAITRVRVDEVLELVGLTSVAGKRVGKFSLGMGQRLGIAAALLGDPGVLLFDEPVNGLDPEGIRWVRTLCKKLAGEGRTVFVSSHLMAEMALTADHLVVIGKGKMIAETSVADFVAGSSRQSVKVRTPAPHQLSDAVTNAGGTVIPDPDGSMTVTGLSAPEVGDLAASIGCCSARTDPRRLTGGCLHGADRRSRRVPRWIMTAVLGDPTPFAIEQPPGRVGLRRAMAAEWTKFWSVRSTMWTLVATAVAVVGLCALGTGTVSPSDIIDDPTRRSLIGIFLGQLIFGVLGVLVMSAEYGTGTIRATLSAVPRRPVVLTAKVLVFGAVAVVVSEVLAFSAFALGQAILSAKNAVGYEGGGRAASPATRGEGSPWRSGPLSPMAPRRWGRRASCGPWSVPVSIWPCSGCWHWDWPPSSGTPPAQYRHSSGSCWSCPSSSRHCPRRISNALARYMPANIGLVMFSTHGVPNRMASAFSPWTGFAYWCSTPW